ncbi:hypothetical protein A2U01_0110143, partial [Trifolium medium]|nr:hypothetical protein [Trifolium medium]
MGYWVNNSWTWQLSWTATPPAEAAVAAAELQQLLAEISLRRGLPDRR